MRVRAKLIQLRLTLCDPMDCSLPDSSVHGIPHARILGWVVMPSSRGSSPPRDRTLVSYSSCIVGEFFMAETPGKPRIDICSVQLLSCVQLFATPWTAEHQPSLSITKSWSLLNFMSIESVMPSNHLILCHPLLPPSSFPASGSFPMSQLFALGGQSIGASASASVLPMNTQHWFLL